MHGETESESEWDIAQQVKHLEPGNSEYFQLCCVDYLA